MSEETLCAHVPTFKVNGRNVSYASSFLNKRSSVVQKWPE
jgi:hypothetical protein